jgi:hypothetical protein
MVQSSESSGSQNGKPTSPRLRPDYLAPFNKSRASFVEPIRQFGWLSNFGGGTGFCIKIAWSRKAGVRERR